MDFKEEIEKTIRKIVKNAELEVPSNSELGDYALPCFPIAKEFKKNPAEIAKDLTKKMPKIKGIEKIQAAGPYVNFFIDRQELVKQTLSEIFRQKDKYGKTNIGKNKTVVIDYSSPNIAKPFGIAHIRSTVMGNALYKIHGFLGYNAVRVNHLGDWGTQFGKLIVAFEKWGNKKNLEKEGIGHLVNIYVKFGEESEINPELNDEAREWFKRLEQGDKKAYAYWDLFRKMSLKEFERYYKKLNIKFDSYEGEAFYNDKLEAAVKHIQSKTKTEMSEGALIVNLEKYNMPPVLLRKSDEASTYHTRDLAAALHRIKKYKPEKIIYVVGAPQLLHFQQVFKVLELIGENKNKFVHVPFGNMTYEGSTMSTRAGNFILLEEVLDKSVELALKTINQKNPKLKNKGKAAELVGIGAVIFGDLVNDRIRDINFSWGRVLDFEGETAPYLQYTYARINSLIKKSGTKVSDKINFDRIKNEAGIMKKLSVFNEIIMQAHNNYKPHTIARYLIELAQMFNAYYQNVPILKQDKETTNARLLISYCVGQVLKNGLNLLGIEAPEEM